MAIVKKNKGEKLYSKENYIISPPTILSTEKKEYGKTYSFIFTEPLIHSEGAITGDNFIEVDSELIKNNNRQKAGTSDYTNNQSDKKKFNVIYDFDENGHNIRNVSILDIDMANEKNEKEIFLPTKENIMFTFSKPDYVIDDVNELNNSFIETTINKVTQCKVCWIFKKPTCEDCVTKCNGENELQLYNKSEICQIKTSHRFTEKKPCKFCWIFKNQNCYICKSSRKIENAFSKISTTVGSESKASEKKLKLKKREDYEANLIFTAKATPDNIMITEIDNKSRKRKIVEDSYKICKKAKWQCNICLTVNKTNRETCICCEHYVLHTEMSVSKFNWEHNEIFVSNFGQKVLKNVPSFIDNVNNNIASEICSLEKTNAELKISYAKQVKNKQEDLSFCMEKERNEQLQSNISEILPIEEDMDISENIVTTIDMGTNVRQMAQLDKNINNNNTHQAHNLNFLDLSLDNTDMDVSEDISKASPLTPQFNIGKVPQDEKKNRRRLKKPLRRTQK